ncbi:MAG: hypothetical protein AAGM38_17140 [Pseudomonadota bacterium]
MTSDVPFENSPEAPSTKPRQKGRRKRRSGAAGRNPAADGAKTDPRSLNDPAQRAAARPPAPAKPVAAPTPSPPAASSAPAAAPPSKTALAEGRIDGWFGALRFHHAFNAISLSLLLMLVFAAPQLTLLPFYLALVARVPSLHLQRRYGFSRTQAALSIAALAFLTLIATALTLLLPLVLQAATIDRAALEQVRPFADALAVWANAFLENLGVSAEELGAEGGLTAKTLIEWAAGDVGEGAAMLLRASGVLLKPFVFIALSLLVVFMASYALASSEKLKRETRRFLRVCWPERTVAILERLTLHAQYFGAEVFRGYCWMVLVLGVFYFMVYLGAIALFEAAQALPPAIVVAMLTLSAVIGAVPGLGAKILLLIGAVAGLAIGVLAVLFTGDLWLGVYIFVAVTVVTGFESKFGTPSTLGRALGVNSCLMLFLAISVVAAFGVAATLWTIFVILPILVAGMRVMTELYGDKPETDAPIPSPGPLKTR